MKNIMRKFRETFVRRLKTYEGRSVGFRIDRVRLPNGRPAIREYLNHPGAVAVVPVAKDGRVLMVRQYRYPVGEITWEIPAGKLDPGESPARCVRRELEEETGCKAKRLRRLLTYWPTAAFANEVIHVYAATGLTTGQANPDADEFLDCAPKSLSGLLRDIRRGNIKDSKTIIALLAYARWSRRAS